MGSPSIAILFKNAQIITAGRVITNGWLLCQGSQIRAFGEGLAPDYPDAEPFDCSGLILMPGFIDVHAHGAMNAETMDATPGALQTIAGYYAQHGVTSFLPTTWTDTPTRVRAGLENIAANIGGMANGATILGAHLEGPYLNAKMAGAQNPAHARRAKPDEVIPLLDLNVIRLFTVAPEFDENHWAITECVRRGVAVSAAHTAATYAQMQTAAALGVTHVTHIYNAMIGLHHREPGTVGAAMTIPSIRCELIADNIHVHPVAQQVLFAAKGKEGVMLISDAIRPAGMPDGDYAIDERIITLKNGEARLPDGTLAGSTLMLDTALFNFMRATGQPLSEMWQSTSLNAARSIGVSQRKGSIEVDKDADLVLIDLHADHIEVVTTIAEGKIVFQNKNRHHV